MSAPVPTFRHLAVRPRWIAALLGCLALAAVFALLGQWQIARAVEQGRADDRDTETPVQLASVAAPGEGLTTEAGGRMVAFSGSWVPEDFDTLAGRRQDDRIGTWVIGRVLIEQASGEPASLAVALSWFEDPAAAVQLAGGLEADATGDLVGRLMPTETPTMGDVQGDTREAMSVAALINEWDDWDGSVYGTYAILDEPSAAASGALDGGSEPIVSERPIVDAQLNALNIFYAVEWIAFVLFALYLWYRLVRDALEREVEAIEDSRAAPAAAGGAPARG